MDVTALSDRDLMNIFAEFVAWENFVAEELVDAEVEELRAESSLKIVEMKSVAAVEGATTVTAAKAAAKSTPEYEQAHERWVMAKAMRKVLTAQQESLDRTSNFISRELTRRTSMAPAQRRSDRYSP